MMMMLNLSVGVYAQQGKNIVNLGKGNNFYSGLSSHINSNIDTLSNLSVKGTMYVRFTISTSGITAISYSSSAPTMLKKVITEALVNTDRTIFDKSAVREDYYVLPIEYDFLNSGQPERLSQLMDKIPAVTETYATKDINEEFTSLFGISSDHSQNLYGVKCILL